VEPPSLSTVENGGTALVLSAATYNEATFTLDPDQPARVPAPITNVR